MKCEDEPRTKGTENMPVCEDGLGTMGAFIMLGYDVCINWACLHVECDWCY